MSDAARGATEAGIRIRTAREALGLDVGVLAAQLKVPPARLEALEAGQWQALPSGPYARGLAKAVCRALQIDAGPVLEAMPDAPADALAHVSAGLNQPFREAGASEGWGARVWWGVAALALAVALGLLWWPEGPWRSWTDAGPASEASVPAPPSVAPLTAVSSDAASAAPAPLAQPASPPAAQASAQPVAADAVAPAASAETATVATLRIHAQQATWLSVVDARGQVLASRLLQAGETVALDPVAPVRITLGNAPGASVEWRGQTQDLSAYAQALVARLELR